MIGDTIDYDKQLERLKELPRYYLGQEIDTPFGKGIIVELEMRHNGLYLSPELATCTVWYSTEKANPWINYQFPLNQLEEQNGRSL